VNQVVPATKPAHIKGLGVIVVMGNQSATAVGIDFTRTDDKFTGL